MFIRHTKSRAGSHRPKIQLADKRGRTQHISQPFILHMQTQYFNDIVMLIMARLLICVVVAGSLCVQTSLPVVAAESSVMVEMRDGVKLKTTVWLPVDGNYPVVLIRGYSSSGLGEAAPKWNQKGIRLR